MSRKGMSSEAALITIVIVGLVLIVAAVIYTTLYDVGKSEFSKRECQLSLQLTRSVNQAFKFYCYDAVPTAIPLKCDRKFLTVTKEDVLSDGKSVKFQYNPSCEASATLLDAASEGVAEKDVKAAWTGGACLAQNVVAKEMASCWDTFFRGEVPVFQQIEKDYSVLWNTKNYARACFVCAEVTLDTGKDITNFRDEYLKKKQYTKQQTYYQFLAQNPKAICPQWMRDEGDGTCWGSIGNGVKLNFLQDIWAKIPLTDPKRNFAPIDQNTLPDKQTYAITFIRQGLYEACSLQERDGQIDDRFIPALSVQAIPAQDIAKYCDTVLV